MYLQLRAPGEPLAQDLTKRQPLRRLLQIRAHPAAVEDRGTDAILTEVHLKVLLRLLAQHLGRRRDLLAVLQFHHF